MLRYAFDRNVKSIDIWRSLPTSFAKPKNCETQNSYCKTADGRQGASGSFMAGAGTPDTRRLRSDRENTSPMTPDALVSTRRRRFGWFRWNLEIESRSATERGRRPP